MKIKFKLLVLLSLCAGFMACSNPPSDFKYEEDEGSIRITSYIGKSNKVVIPAKIEGLPVTSICFSEDSSSNFSVTSVSIPKTVNYIDYCAFEDYTKLKEIKIPNSVTYIGNCAFENCTSLTQLEIPDSIETIGSSAFKNCTGITTITITGSIEEIQENAFADCLNLKSVIISDKIKKFAETAFSGCVNLEEIKISRRNRDIAPSVFCYSDNLKSIIDIENGNNLYTIQDGSIYDNEKTELYSVLKWVQGDYIVSDKVKKIRNSAFSDCTKITDIVIPTTVKKLGENAFRGCVSLSNITINSESVQISPDMFRGCKSLKNVKNANGEIVYFLSNGSVYDKDFKKLLLAYEYDSVLSIPEGVTTISKNACRNAIGIRYISIPDTLVTIEDGGLKGTNVNYMTIPAGVRYLGEKCLPNSLIELYVDSESLYAKESPFDYQMSGFKRLCFLDNYYYTDARNILIKYAPKGTKIIDNYKHERLIDKYFTYEYGEYVYKDCFIDVNDLPGVLELYRDTENNDIDFYRSTSFLLNGNITDEILTAIVKVCDEITDSTYEPTLALDFSNVTGFESCILDNSVRFNNIKAVFFPDNIKNLNVSVLSSSNKLDMVGFTGSKEQWNSIFPSGELKNGMDKVIKVVCSLEPSFPHSYSYHSTEWYKKAVYDEW